MKKYIVITQHSYDRSTKSLLDCAFNRLGDWKVTVVKNKTLHDILKELIKVLF